MAVSVSAQFGLTTAETISGITGATPSNVSYDQYDVALALNATTTIPATHACYTLITGVGATSGSIDFTALPGPLSTTQDTTGKKLRLIRIRNLAASTGNFTLATGASNGYPFVTQTLKPGQIAEVYFADGEAAVAAGDKTLDWTCTNNVSVELTLIFG